MPFITTPERFGRIEGRAEGRAEAFAESIEKVWMFGSPPPAANSCRRFGRLTTMSN